MSLLTKNYDHAGVQDLIFFRNNLLFIRSQDKTNSTNIEISIGCNPNFDLYNLQEIRLDILSKKVGEFCQLNSSIPAANKLKTLYERWKANQKRIKESIFHTIYSAVLEYSSKGNNVDSEDMRASNLQQQLSRQTFLVNYFILTKELYSVNMMEIMKISSLFVFKNSRIEEKLQKINSEIQRIIASQEILLDFTNKKRDNEQTSQAK